MVIDVADGDTRDNRLLERLIVFTSGVFSKLTRRIYDERIHTEYFNTTHGQKKLLLKQYPVTSWSGLTRVEDNEAYASSEFQVNTSAGIVMLLDDTFPVGDREIVFTYVAGYTTSNVPDEIAAAVAIQTVSFFNSVKERGFETEKLDAHSYKALGDLEPEFKLAIADNMKMGHASGFNSQ